MRRVWTCIRNLCEPPLSRSAYTLADYWNTQALDTLGACTPFLSGVGCSTPVKLLVILMCNQCWEPLSKGRTLRSCLPSPLPSAVPSTGALSLMTMRHCGFARAITHLPRLPLTHLKHSSSLENQLRLTLHLFNHLLWQLSPSLAAPHLVDSTCCSAPSKWIPQGSAWCFTPFRPLHSTLPIPPAEFLVTH